MKSKNLFRMRLIMLTFIISLLFSGIADLHAQEESLYQVGTWPGFRKCAITYTFDDACPGQFSAALPAFNEHDFQMTFFIVSSWIGNWGKIISAANDGHEIANHTKTHPNFSELDIPAQEAELLACSNAIRSRITSAESLTMAYPYCVKGNDSLHRSHFIAARGCQGFIEGKTPADFMNVSSITCGEKGSVKTAADFNLQAERAANKNGWLVYLIHGIDNDGGYSPLSSGELREGLDYLSENGNRFWVSGFGNVARYVQERNCVLFTETLVNDTIISLEITDTLTNNECYNYPLSIRRPLPEGWKYVKVLQDGSEIQDTLIEINGTWYIQFEAIPDGGTVVIRMETGLNVPGNAVKGEAGLKVWKQEDELFFRLQDIISEKLNFQIYGLNGELIFAETEIEVRDGRGSLNLKHSLFRPGIYFLRISGKQNSWSAAFIY